MKKHAIDAADEAHILEVLNSRFEDDVQQVDSAETKLNSQTFRHYRDQRMEEGKKTNEDIKQLFK